MWHYGWLNRLERINFYFIQTEGVMKVEYAINRNECLGFLTPRDRNKPILEIGCLPREIVKVKRPEKTYLD